MSIKDILDRVDRQQVQATARRALKVASEAAGLAIQLRSDSGPLGILSVAAKVVHTVIDGSSTEPFSGWTLVKDVGPLDAFALAIAKQGHVSAAPGMPPNMRVMVGSIHGVRIGWVEYERWLDGPFVSPEYSREQATEVLRAMLWEACGQAVLYTQPALSPAMLQDDSVGEAHPSKTATEIWDAEAEFIRAARRRSVLLAGEPGVGKSSIVRCVAERAGGHRLRIKARDLEHLRSLSQLIAFLQPDVVVIDDLCRAKDKAGILDELDAIMSTAKLLMVTVNRLDALDGAAVRRFDTVKTIDRLDDAVLAGLLAGVPEPIAVKLRSLPIKYIDKYREAVDVLGQERAADLLDALQAQHELVTSIMAKGSVSAGVATTAPTTEITKG